MATNANCLTNGWPTAALGRLCGLTKPARFRSMGVLSTPPTGTVQSDVDGLEASRRSAA
jgi:hypothetical protein